MAIFLSAGHHNNDSGASGSGYQENKLTIEFRDLVLQVLKSKYPTYKVIVDNDNETLSQYLNRIKTGEGSVVLEIHFDAFNSKAQGCTALIADKHNEPSKKMGEELTDLTSKILNTSNRGVKTESQSNRGRLALTRKTGTTVLIELEFIDNPEAMKRYHDNKHWLAEDYAYILTKYDDLVS